MYSEKFLFMSRPINCSILGNGGGVIVMIGVTSAGNKITDECEIVFVLLLELAIGDPGANVQVQLA